MGRRGAEALLADASSGALAGGRGPDGGRCTADGREIRAWDVPQKIGSMALRREGGAIVSLQRGFHTLDFKTGEVTLIHDPEPGRDANRFNDGKVDRQGRFVAGSMDTMEEGANGALDRLDPNMSVHQLDDGIICSNGPCWSPDGRTFYFTDTWTGEIWAYDYDTDTGSVSNRRTFATVDTSGGGAADGATVNAEGCVLSALVYDGKLVRYTPDGTVDRVIDMPVKKVTSFMFGGPNLDVLYVTTMAKPAAAPFPKRRAVTRQPVRHPRPRRAGRARDALRGLSPLAR